MITFVKGKNLKLLHDFYTEVMGYTLWRDQGICRIYDSGYGYLGFCSHEPMENQGLILCHVVESPEEVEAWFGRFLELGLEIISPPVEKEAFGIYQFFARDVEGNKLEIQCFM